MSRRPVTIAGALAGLLASVAATGFALWYVPRERAEAIDGWRSNLSLLAELRQSAIERWVQSGLADAQVVAGYPSSRQLVADPRQAAAGSHLTEVLASFAASEGYRRVWLLGPDLEVLAVSGGGQPAAASLDLVRAALQEEQAVGYRTQPDGSPTVGFARRVPGEARAGVALLEADPARWLHPFLSAGLSHSSMEAYLVGRAGTDVLYLTPLRHADALPTTRPLATPGLAGAEALTSQHAFGRRIDYRGVPVLAEARRIPGTDWGVVVKVDEAEALAPLGEHLQQAAAGLALGVLGFGAVVFLALRLLEREHEVEQGRRRAELADLLDRANDAVLYVSPHGRILDCNARAETLYGRSRAELRTLSVADLRTDEARPGTEADLARGESGAGYIFETTHQHRDGSPIPVEVSARPTQRPGGRVLVAIVRDVRERRAAEARIRQLTRLLETIVEVNQAVIRAQARQPLLAEACRVLVERGGFALAWVGLVEPDRDELTVAASAPPDAPYLQGLVVRRDDTPLGRGPTGTAAREGIDLVNEDTASNPALLPWRERQLAHGYRSSAAFPLRVHDAVVGVVNIYATLPGSVGPDETRLLDELVGDLGFALEGLEARQELRDLNESLERRVRERTAALEDANRELEAFSYSVSHDLRAPLRSIDGFSLLVLEEHAAQLDAEGLRLLGVVRSATHRMGQLIDALLDLSRASRRDLRPTRVAMRPLVASVLAELVPEGASHRPTFEVNELPDAWGDEALLRQVWVNLLGNALKFSARQAEPQVDVSFQARPGEPGRYLVRDNGVGFDSSHADRIFGVFQRLHSASEFEGHGVGLALVQRIVHRHGGAVGAEGSPGAGATFWFSLPDPPEDWS